MDRKKLITKVLFLFLILSLTSCAPAGVTENEYGFFAGIWHGFILTFSLIGRFIFGYDIGLWAETNSGVLYYTGWIIGILIIGIISLGKL
ncbi:hypothetical protein RM549_03145 [Salegentibacter sp. F188]|uniref:Uncharacterized protein n=1 Tax=Autumnicola patrickiae TaxID=3075591 RepID=A0ABU3DYF6_9FLAO|nr:hypothetical protein [Salegentibacter sp. F188]MDT0688762.1 hypothetical protein [Salegentibacter sp. F188]